MAKNKWYGDKVKRKLINEMKDKLELAGAFVEGEAKVNIINMKAVDTGKLLNSIDHEMIGKLKVRIGTNTEYAVYVELGTSKMSPRPFLRNAVNLNKKKIKDILAK